jgi:hypothetical protein
MTIQAMKFSKGREAVEVTELFSDNTVMILFTVEAGFGSGKVIMNVKNMIELRKWLNIQIRKVSPKIENKK